MRSVVYGDCFVLTAGARRVFCGTTADRLKLDFGF